MAQSRNRHEWISWYEFYSTDQIKNKKQNRISGQKEEEKKKRFLKYRPWLFDLYLTLKEIATMFIQITKC